jgi:D-alanyl-D-alanine carboxypeptidase/D-alanyl-D-alanine-endopeptidase (penicillin-binding protein 4)
VSESVAWLRSPGRATGLLLLVGLVGLNPASAPAQFPAASRVVQTRERLAALLAGATRARIAVVVEDLTGRQRWFEHEPHTPLKPASVMKLLVTAAALERFGPDFAFQTRLYLSGDELWVIGSGDPGLGDERIELRRGRGRHYVFDDWAAVLRASGAERLRTLVLDDDIFDRENRHPDWPPEQASAWYQAPVGGLNFNDNCLDARVQLQDGQIRLILSPPLPGLFVRNALRPGESQRISVRRDLGSDIFEFRGTVRNDASLRPVSAGRPEVFFGHALREALKQRGVEITGQVVRRSIPVARLAGLTPLAVHRTTLDEVLWRCNTFSQNLFAECLLKALAAYQPSGAPTGTPGGWEAGLAVLRATLEGLGLELRGAVLRDGSGLSHSNRVTADQLVRLLAIMHEHRYGHAFIGSLAAAGQEGTMRSRYGEAALVGRLRGKTGTIREVSALAGYLQRSDGVLLAFAILINGEAPGDLPLRICRVLADSRPEPGP